MDAKEKRKYKTRKEKKLPIICCNIPVHSHNKLECWATFELWADIDRLSIKMEMFKLAEPKKPFLEQSGQSWLEERPSIRQPGSQPLSECTSDWASPASPASATAAAFSCWFLSHLNFDPIWLPIPGAGSAYPVLSSRCRDCPGNVVASVVAAAAAAATPSRTPRWLHVAHRQIERQTDRQTVRQTCRYICATNWSLQPEVTKSRVVV